MNRDCLVNLSLSLWCVCTSVCVSESQTERDDKKVAWEERVSVVLTGRWSLLLSPEVFHFTPHYTRLFPSACHSLSSNIHSLVSFSSRSLSSLCACLLCWLHVKCQVQSQLTDLLWRVRGCKTSKAMSPAHSSITPSVSGAVCIGKAPACWEASRPSAVSKDLLGWNPPSKDTWQPFTATRDRTSTDPTVVPPLLVSRRLFVTGHSWVSVSFMFLQAESVMSEWHFYAWLVVWNVRKITLIPQYFI